MCACRESNPRNRIGNPVCYHYITSANVLGWESFPGCLNRTGDPLITAILTTTVKCSTN